MADRTRIGRFFDSNFTWGGIGLIVPFAIAGAGAAGLIGAGVAAESAVGGSGALVPMAEAAFNTGTIRTIAGYQVGGNAGSALGPLLATFILPRGQRSIAWFSFVALLGIILLLLLILLFL